MLGDFRIKHNLPSKRPKDRRPKTIDVTFRNNGVDAVRKISRTEWPAPVFFYKFGPANILRGLRHGTGIFEQLPYALHDKGEMKRLSDKHGRVILKVKNVCNDFARIIAKIGYGYAVAELGLGSFEPLKQTLDIILCKDDDVGFVVGSNMSVEKPQPERFHELGVEFHVVPFRSPLLLATVRLFAMMETPEYHVALGTVDPKNPRHVNAFAEQLSNTESIQPLRPLV